MERENEGNHNRDKITKKYSKTLAIGEKSTIFALARRLFALASDRHNYKYSPPSALQVSADVSVVGFACESSLNFINLCLEIINMTTKAAASIT